MSVSVNENSENLREQLVAYLDGELSAEESRHIEALMASNPAIRDEIARLESTWRMLDTLPRAEADEAFTRTTVEIVALHAAQEVEGAERQAPRRRHARLLLLAAGMFLAGFLGVMLADWLWPHPDERLLRDYPVLQQMDPYRHADNIEFLRQLHEQGWFRVESDSDHDAP
jgi:anti-sigma factor RsiW